MSVVQPYRFIENAGHLPSTGYASTCRCYSDQMHFRVSESSARRSGYTGSAFAPPSSNSLISAVLGTETLPDYTTTGTMRIRAVDYLSLPMSAFERTLK